MTIRFAAAMVALTLVVLASLEVPLGVNNAQRRQDQLLVAAERDALGLGDAVEDLLEQGDPAASTEATRVAELYGAQTDGRVLVVDGEGISLADTDPPPGTASAVGRSFASRPEIAQALTGRTATGSRYSSTLGETLVYVAAPIRSGDRVLGAVRISHSRHEVDEDIATYWRRLAGIAGVTLLAAAVIGLLLGRWVARPVRQLQLQARAFGSGDLDARAETDSGPPEVRELAAQFNRSAERLAGALRTTSQFAADAAHQFRTPLTVLRLRIENLRAGEDPVDDERLDPLDDELARMERTIDVLLALARLDERPPTMEPVDLHVSLARAAATWEPAATDAGVEVVHRAGDPVMAVADPDHLEQIVDNLVANALAAVPTGSTVELEAGAGPDGPELRVVDHGPGIDPAVRDRARQRHWHDSTGGTGLGLAIVDRLCQHDQATLHLDETPGGGLTARIAFTAPTTHTTTPA